MKVANRLRRRRGIRTRQRPIEGLGIRVVLIAQDRHVVRRSGVQGMLNETPGKLMEGMAIFPVGANVVRDLLGSEDVRQPVSCLNYNIAVQ